MRIKKVDHVVITTEHLEESIKFYKMLGFEAVNAMGHWEMKLGDFKVNLHVKGVALEPEVKHVQPGSLELCFELDGDLHKLKSYLEGQGLEVAEPRIMARTGAKGPAMSFYLRDPDGNSASGSGMAQSCTRCDCSRGSAGINAQSTAAGAFDFQAVD